MAGNQHAIICYHGWHWDARVTECSNPSANAAFGHAVARLWEEAVLHEAGTAKRHLPDLGGDTDNDRPAKDAAERPHISLDRPSGNTDRVRIQQRFIHDIPIGKKASLL